MLRACSNSLPWHSMSLGKEGLVGLNAHSQLFHYQNSRDKISNSDSTTSVCDRSSGSSDATAAAAAAVALTSGSAMDCAGRPAVTMLRSSDSRSSAGLVDECINPLWTPLLCIYFSDSFNHIRPQSIDDRLSAHSAARADSSKQSTAVPENSHQQRMQLDKDDDEVFVFWWNRYSMQVSAKPPQPPLPCRGGLLADEMVTNRHQVIKSILTHHNLHSLLQMSNYICV